MLYELLSRSRSLPLVAAVLAGVLVLVAGFMILLPERSEPVIVDLSAGAAPLPATAPLAVEEPDAPASSVEAPAAPTAPEAPAPVEPVEEPIEAPEPVEEFVPADGAQLVNPKSLPMPGAAPAPQQPSETFVIAAPTGALYQRGWAGGYATYAPVTALPTNDSVVLTIRAVFPQAEWSRAERVAGCESGMRSVSSKPNQNGSLDHGIFQLNDGGTLQGLLKQTGEDPANVQKALDVEWNVKAARLLWQQRGWQPWTCAAKLGIVDGLYSSKPGPNW